MDSEPNRNDTSSVDEPAEQAGSTTSNLVYLALLGGLLTYLVLVFDLSLIAILMVALGLTFVVFVHELGHFAVAKWCDVHVEAFSIGFGPALPGCSFRYGETTYMIGILPLGGYVKMVGEGPDAEDGEDDPRSFKNKSVWQRMAIISAGVTMNLILALACFVFVYRTHGADRSPGVVEILDPGSPAWKLGVKSGDIIQWIGNRGPHPYFDELRPVVMNSRANEKLNFVWGPPNAKEQEMRHDGIEPKKNADDSRPVIGIAPPRELKLMSSDHKERELPTFYSNAASKAQPPFEFEDEIVGTTDPKDSRRVTELPPDPRHPGYPDYFAFLKRMEELAGQRVVLRVARESQGRKTTVDIQVPPAYHWVLGMRMRMGAIAAVRDGSPAAKAGILPGDVIDQAEVRNEHGEIVRFLSSGLSHTKLPGVIEQDLDPVRLPWQLSHTIGASKSAKVTLTVVRTNPASGATHSERQPKTLDKAPWDSSWRFNQEMPVTPASPMSIPELGLAYLVETRILAVAPESAASRAVVIDPVKIKFQKGDQIQRNGTSLNAAEGEAIDLQSGDQISLRPSDVAKAIRFMKPREHSSEKIVPDKNWQSIKSDQWAYFFNILQMEVDSKDIDLQVDRDGQTLSVRLAAQQDKYWPLVDRGIPLIYDTRLQKATTLAQAMGMGMNETWDFITQIYQNLEGLITRRVSPDMFGGPIMIAHIAYKIAGHDYYRLISFLGIISVNLAVINFLPIPVLDGGHMVFLLYEKLRGRPAPKRIQEAATYIGLALIFCLLVAVVFHDFLNLRRM